MPDLDLEPHEYRDRSGTNRAAMVGHKRFARGYFFFCLVALTFIFFTRDAGTSATTFGLTVMFSFIAGVFAMTWADLTDRSR